MKPLALGFLLTCAFSAYLMPQLAVGCLLVAALLAAALILDRGEAGCGR